MDKTDIFTTKWKFDYRCFVLCGTDRATKRTAWVEHVFKSSTWIVPPTPASVAPKPLLLLTWCVIFKTLEAALTTILINTHDHLHTQLHSVHSDSLSFSASILFVLLLLLLLLLPSSLLRPPVLSEYFVLCQSLTIVCWTDSLTWLSIAPSPCGFGFNMSVKYPVR